MWAVIDLNFIVINYLVGITYEEALKKSKGFSLIEMTIKNSPASIGSFYNGSTFEEPATE
jgi:hypothetical protein